MCMYMCMCMYTYRSVWVLLPSFLPSSLPSCMYSIGVCTSFFNVSGGLLEHVVPPGGKGRKEGSKGRKQRKQAKEGSEGRK